MNIEAPRPIHIPALKELWYEAFGDTEEFLEAFFTTAFSTERSRIATINEEIVAALYWFDCRYSDKRIAYLYAIATAQAYRGQGICHKLMKDTHLHLTMLGYEGIILVPGNKELFKLYGKMGYKTCCHIREFISPDLGNIIPSFAREVVVELRCINQHEYAALRRQMLPKGGVIQENANLNFLQTHAKFYAGPCFLLAAHKQANILYGVELLGDSTIAPGLVRALGCEKGIFRTPGTDKPFAMYYPLGDSTLQPPSYFGLAFD